MAKGVKFRDTVARYQQIGQDIKAGRLSGIYLLMGEEGFFIDRLADLIADNVLDEAQRSFNQTVVYGKDTDEDTIINLVRQVPMMGGYQVVIVKEAAQLRKIEQLSFYTARPVATSILVLCYKGKSLDKRSQLYKQIEKSGVVFESVRPYDNEIGAWLNDYVGSLGCRIEPKALTMLTDHLGTDLSRISNELDKLLTRLPQGTRHITAEQIETNIGINKDFNNFELVKAVGGRDMAKAFQIADYFRRNPKNYPFVVTTVTLYNYFQKLFVINYRNWQTRKRGAAPATDNELASLIKVSPFLVGEYKRSAQLYPNQKLFAILGFVRAYDMKGKGVDSGSADENELLRELLLKIFMA